ncbi:cytochrome P450 9e2-like [Harmonia axyridis]|uniref:cytochrome P450 9e2-like n=1 Tax=Harmonia axyridis TaxID=115357 RepID=UPI001E2796E2|nr:cytochrome P450 9e2-like [Harmonia axyridis]
MSNVPVAVSIIFSTLILYYYNYTYWRRNRVKQRFPQVPIFGDNYRHFFGKSPYHKVLEALYWKFPTARYTGFYQYMQPGLMIRDMKLVRKVCVEDFDTFKDRKSFLPRSADPLWNKNLFALQGDKWRQMRNTLSYSFTANNMEVIWDLVNNTADRFCNHLLRNTVNDEIEVKFKDIFTRFATDVIGTTAFGYEVDSMGHPNNEFYKNGCQAMLSNNFWRNFKLQLCLILPILGKIFKAHIFDKEVSRYFRSLIWGIIDRREENDIERADMLQLLVRRIPETHFDNDDITSQALVFFLGGFETVSSALCFMAYELALNPDIQERLYKEINDFRETHKREITYEDTKGMRYLEMVFNETLRKWPPLLNMDRMCVEPYTIKPEKPGEETVHLEESTLIWIPIWAIHHDPEHWPNPEVFDPERFRDNTRTPNGFIPFGLGNRGCLGFRFATMEIKLLFIHLLTSFKIERSSKSQVPFVPVVHSFSLTSEDGFCFKLVKRQKPNASTTCHTMAKNYVRNRNQMSFETGPISGKCSFKLPFMKFDPPRNLRFLMHMAPNPSTIIPTQRAETQKPAKSENQLPRQGALDSKKKTETFEDSKCPKSSGETQSTTKKTQTSKDSECPKSNGETQSIRKKTQTSERSECAKSSWDTQRTTRETQTSEDSEYAMPRRATLDMDKIPMPEMSQNLKKETDKSSSGPPVLEEIDDSDDWSEETD